MRQLAGFRDYKHFRDELARHRSSSWSATVEDIADEMYRSDVQDEFHSLWDAADEDDEI